MSEAIKNRYEFVLLFDVKNGNPNGDPDAGNLPRIDPETNHGIVTDVCLKRKIRNYVDLVKENVAPYEIHVREGNFLSENHKRAHLALSNEKAFVGIPKDLCEELKEFKGFPAGIEFVNNETGKYLSLLLNVDFKKCEKEVKDIKKLSAASIAKIKELFVDSKEKQAGKWMCKNFFDVRTFGSVMSTGDKRCGQIRGPIQMAFAKSHDPILGLDISMSRTAAVSVDKPEDKGLGARKSIVPYGLYCTHGFISAPLAKQTGFSEEDLELFWNALMNMFDHDRSAARGEMATQKLIVFKHSSELGNAPAQKLFELVEVKRNKENEGPARSIKDYDVSIAKGACPQAVEIIEML